MKRSSPTNDWMKGGWTLSEDKNKTRQGRTIRKSMKRDRGESRRMTKNHERENFAKEKIVHT